MQLNSLLVSIFLATTASADIFDYWKQPGGPAGPAQTHSCQDYCYGLVSGCKANCDKNFDATDPRRATCIKAICDDALKYCIADC
ncbi:hypothetical protein E4U55_006306 [Claviceps digitariae]|nr:hypothetical protein E4U55_006306 [Claviceps digitariae]